MASTLYRGGVVHADAHPFATALLVDGGAIAWIGDEDVADGLAPNADEVLDLNGALVAPGFVDAHVHLLETALTARAADLTGTASLAEALSAIERIAADTPPGEVVLGYGWDEQRWPEQRPPTAEELNRAVGDRPAYVARVDVHSAVVSSALARDAGAAGHDGWDASGWLRTDAHHAVRDHVRAVPAETRERLYRRALQDAAKQGIVSVHEMSAPGIDTREGLRQILALTCDPASGLPHVVGYRGEWCVDEAAATALLADLPGIAGIGGDLNADGSIGSRTAAMREPYTDEPVRPEPYADAAQVATHVAAVTEAGSRAGFHVIGDRAMDVVLAGLDAVADERGASFVRRGGHRLEHAPFTDDAALATMGRLGLVASMQPAFNATWGGPEGTYAARLGVERSLASHRFAALAWAGVPLAFGSDSPVTAMSPWAGVRAAVVHPTAEQRISARAAFRAHTRGGWRAARLDGDGSGQLRVGAPAHLAIWRGEHLVVQGTGEWSTDARSGTPLLPELGPDVPLPRCERTVRAGVVLYDRLG